MKSVITEELRKVFFESFIFGKTKDLVKDDGDLLVENAETFGKGECVYSEKSFKRALGVIVDGKVRVTTVNKDSGIVLKDMGKTDVFGAAAVFSVCSVTFLWLKLPVSVEMPKSSAFAISGVSASFSAWMPSMTIG